MPRLLPLLILTLFVGTACRPAAYVQPLLTEPHAILKIRHIVHARRGPMYASAIRIGEFSVDERTLEDVQSDAAIIHLRIHPTPDAFSVRGESYHMESRLVTRYRTEQQSYSCPQQQCSGYGTSRSCHTVYSTCTRSHQVPYTAHEMVPVVDDACGDTFPFAPRVGSSYLLQFDYLGENQCRLTCFEQVLDGVGGFVLSPCERVALPPPR